MGSGIWILIICVWNYLDTVILMFMTGTWHKEVRQYEELYIETMIFPII